MKEFEKMTGFEKWLWYFRDENRKWLAPTLAKYRTDKEDEAAKDGWKAALKEILSQLEHPIYSADIMKWIRKELDG